MSACSRCENLSSEIPNSGTLYISPPLAHTQNSLRQYLKEAAIPYDEPYPSIVAIPVVPDRLQQLNDGLGRVLSSAEMQDSKSLVLGEGVVPSISDLMAMQPLSTLLGRVQGAWLADMIGDGRLLSHYQPIVHTQEPGNIFAYEALLRGKERDGSMVYPDRLFGAALTSDMLFQLDRAARVSAVHCANQHGLKCNIFVNFNPTSIYDPVYCLRTTLHAIKMAEMKSANVIFEVVESSEIKDSDHLSNILKFYRDKGFRIALDDLGSGYGSLNLLSKIRPDFVKLDMQLVRDVDKDRYKAQVASKILEMASALGVETIMEGIETEGEWLWAKEHGADYVQGYFFARPASPPPLPKIPQSMLVPAF